MTPKLWLKRTLVISACLLCVAGASLAVAWLLSDVDEPRNVPKSVPKNVVIISVDALSRSWLGVYDRNAPRLPGIERLAARSAVFDRAYTTAPWTLPAHASLLTGCYPPRHGAITHEHQIADGVKPLAEWFGKAGYLTAGFSGGGYVSKNFGFDRGFQIYDRQRSAEGKQLKVAIPRGGRRTQTSGEKLFDRGIALIKHIAKKNAKVASGEEVQPFFLFLHTYMVHDYFQEHPWAVEALPEIMRAELRGHFVECVHGSRRCSSSHWAQLEELYRAELRRLDDGMRNLVDYLERRRLLEDTYIVFLTDHGEGFDHQHRRIHHGGRMHADLIHIPLMISGPGIVPGRVAGPVSLIDVLPTLMDLNGLPVPIERIDGRSVMPALRGEVEDATRTLYAFEDEFYWDHRQRKRRSRGGVKHSAMAVIQGDHWYIRDGSVEEIYDYARDPLQYHDLTDSEPAKLESMRAQARLLRGRKASSSKAQLDEDLNGQLKALGYFDDEDDAGGEPNVGDTEN